MSYTLKLAIAVNKALLQAVIDEDYDCPGLQSVYYQGQLRSTVQTEQGGAKIILFGIYTKDRYLVDQVVSELQLALQRYIYANETLYGEKPFGVLAETSPESDPLCKRTTRFKKCDYGDFDFSRVDYANQIGKTA